MDEEKIKKIYDSLGSRFELPDYDTFKKDLISNPEKRQKAFETLGESFEMPSFGQFEAEIFGNVPKDEPKKEASFLGKALALFNLFTPNLSPDVKRLTSEALVGSEFGVKNTPSFLENFALPIAKYLAKNDADARGIFDPTGIGALFVEPKEKKTEQEIQTRVKEIDDRQHELYKEMHDSRLDLQEKYVQGGLIDPARKKGFWDEQAFSFGMNLPYLITGTGSTKLGLSGVATTAKFLGYPLFTIMEASSFAGEVYGETAKKDKDGRVIQGTGDLDKTNIAMPFGILAGLLEFWGVSQAVDMVGKSLVKDVGFKFLGKELSKVALAEGGEEIAQDAIEQLTMMGLDLKDKFSFQQSLDSFVAGSVGGLLLGGVSVPVAMADIQKVKDFAEKDAVDKINTMESKGIIPKEKADELRKTADILVNTSVEELQPKIVELNKALKNL